MMPAVKGGFSSFGLPGDAPPAGATVGVGGGFSFGVGAVRNNAPLLASSPAAASSRTASASTTTTTTPRTTVRALAWDPTGAASLALCPASGPGGTTNRANEGGGGGEGGGQIDVFLSHDGTGCPPHEAECLLRCLDAREEWTLENSRRRPGSRRRGGATDASSAAKLSADYRAALCECLMRLRENQGENDDEGGGGDGGGVEGVTEEAGNNLELLCVTYAVSHLAEIFLLPDPSSPDGGGRLDGPPGSITADAVRYLRLHHSTSPMDSPGVSEMLETDQPEYFQFHPDTAAADAIPGPYPSPYWNLLLRLVMTGRLSDAWNLLSRHSACRRAEEEAESAAMAGVESEMSPEGQGFAALRAILLSAPVPGGRGDPHCADDHGLDEYSGEEDLLLSEEAGGGGEEDEDMEGAEDPGDINRLMVDGVPPNAYLLWEARPRRDDVLRSLRYRRTLRRCGRADDVPGSPLDSPAVPETYQPRAAAEALGAWRETARDAAFPAGGAGDSRRDGVLSALFRRFPPLSQITSVLLGGALPPPIADDPGLTWSDFLLAELLYARPDVRPGDVAVRAGVAMARASRWGGGHRNPLEEVVLGVMEGEAGRVVETTFALCGGSSGAALPATMTSLLCDLLVAARRISPHTNASGVNIQTELLLLAGESILSSFSVQGQSNVGVRTAVRLLIPHAYPKKDEDGNTIYEPRIAAMVAEVLSRRLPTTDAEARDLLDMCEEAVRLGSVPMAEACESLAFGRAQHYRSVGDPAREAGWLLRGMEALSSWPPHDRRRILGFASRRLFDDLCERLARNLIGVLARAAVGGLAGGVAVDDGGGGVVSALSAAEAVLREVEVDQFMAPALRGHIGANLLGHVVDLATADSDVGVASGIVSCLEEHRLADEYGGVASTLADPASYADFLHVAFAVLAREEEAAGGAPPEFAKCSFDVHGIHVLMARLTQVLSWEGICGSSPKSSLKQQAAEKTGYYGAMRQAFCMGLMRVFVAEGSPAPVNADDGKGGSEVALEEEVELMLDPCI